jgi:hypothetical protein
MNDLYHYQKVVSVAEYRPGQEDNEANDGRVLEVSELDKNKTFKIIPILIKKKQH